MSASAFHPISTALTLVSQSLSEVATALPQGTTGAGATADTLVEKLTAWRGEFNRIAEHMQTQVDGPVETTAAADDELTRHPSPEQVEEAQERARAARKQLMAKAITSGQFQAIADEAEELRAEREKAVRQHAETIRDMDKFESKTIGNNSLSGIDPYGTSGGISSLGGSGLSGGGMSGAGIGTHTSLDPTAGGARMGGVPQPPQMPPMQPTMAQQPALGGGMPTGMGGMPSGAMPSANLPRDKRKDANGDVAVGLSSDHGGMGGGAVGAIPVESRGDSVKGLTTKSDISGLSRPIAAGGAAPGAGGAGGAGGVRPMMGGGPMGSGVGLSQGKPKEKPVIYSSDRDLLGDSSTDEAIRAGLIGRESSKPPSERVSK